MGFKIKFVKTQRYLGKSVVPATIFRTFLSKNQCQFLKSSNPVKEKINLSIVCVPHIVHLIGQQRASGRAD